MGNICCVSPSPEPFCQKFNNRISISNSQIKHRVSRNFESFDSIYSLSKEKLGYGSYGDVKLCTNKMINVSKAVKIINKDHISSYNIENSWFLNKIEILNSLCHPLIITFHEFFEERDDFYLLMDFHQEGDLLKYISRMKKLSETSVRFIINQLLISINYIHKKKIAHRDIKLENILISDKNGILIKLIDFDTAAFYEKNQLKGRNGTSHYMAPETLNQTYTEKCDIWSCGIVMFALLTGRHCLPGLTDGQNPSKVKNAKLDFSLPIFRSISESSLDLLKCMLDKNPNKRISAENALKHNWFSGIIESYRPIAVKLLVAISRSADSLIRKSARKLLVYLAGSDSESALADKTFIYLDKDYDGYISLASIQNCLQENNHKAESFLLTEKIMKIIESPDPNKITYRDFLKASMKPENLLASNNLKILFDLISSEGTKISSADIIEKLNIITFWDGEEVEAWSSLFQDHEFLDFQSFSSIVLNALVKS